MNSLWKFSKSSALVLALTSFVGICVLIFAYRLHHYTEILSGVIGGLTIILGMVTAEWLRSAREAAVLVRSSSASLSTKFTMVIYNAEFLLNDPYSKNHREEFTASQEVLHELNMLAIQTRWPTPNAKEIRRKANDLVIQFYAMVRDALENEHLWSAQRRFKFIQDFFVLLRLLQGLSKTQLDAKLEVDQKYLSYRETEVRDGMTAPWRRQAEGQETR